MSQQLLDHYTEGTIWDCGYRMPVVCIADCVNHDPPEMVHWVVNCPIVGSVYTIREIALCGPNRFRDPVFFRLFELHNPAPPLPHVEVLFWRGLFRPCKYTSIEVFESILQKCSEDRCLTST
jgi:hypothetical protein